MTPTQNIQELLDRVDRALDTPDRVLITELAQALKEAQSQLGKYESKAYDIGARDFNKEAFIFLSKENETLRKRLAAAELVCDTMEAIQLEQDGPVFDDALVTHLETWAKRKEGGE